MSQKQLNKTLQYIKTKQSAAQAKDSSNKFTQKQSQFVRRQEEQQVRDASSSSGTNVISRFEAIRRVGATQTPAPARPQAGNRLMSATGPRWANKYRLDDAPNPQDTEKQPEPTGLGSLLGAAIASPASHDDAGEDEGPRKKSRIEKFQEVISNSRQHRHEQQRERLTRDKETDDLDAEFDTVMHLLTKRDRLQEDREAFELSGTAEVRELLQEFKSSGRTAKVFKLTASGELAQLSAPTGVPPPKTQASGDIFDEEDKKLLAKVRQGQKPTPDLPVPTTASAPAVQEPDDFEALMGVMRMATKKAHATDRTLTEEEEFARMEKMRQQEIDRSLVPLVDTDGAQLTRKEWLEQGGESAYHMDDDDGNADFDYQDEEEDADEVEEGDESASSGDENEVDEDNELSSAPRGPASSSHGLNAVDAALSDLEQYSRTACNLTAAARSERYQQLLEELYTSCRRHPMHAAQSFRGLLMECQKRLNAQQPLPVFLKLVLLTIPYVYPTTDYRHQVVTPFLIFLCAALTQHAFNTLEDVATAIHLASILVTSMTGSGKFCAEMLVAPLNIIALQAPKSKLEPAAHRSVRMPCPLIRRCDDALLCAQGPRQESRESMTKPLSILSASTPNVEQLLFAAYKLLAAVATSLNKSAAFPCAVAEPVALLFELIDSDVHPSLVATHKATLETIQAMSKEAASSRTPLAMRTFRPRPIRLFEPLLVENIDPEKKEHRELKKELREDRKRVVRQVQAEAVVERRAREKEAAADSARREEKYHQLMGELQAQQHIMKTVDMSMAKARSNKKKSISGLPNTSEGGGEEGAK